MATPVLINPQEFSRIPPNLEWLFFPTFNKADWLEAVNLYSPTQLGIGHKRSHATLTGYIPFNRLKDAVTFFLGWSWVDSLGFLHRRTPAPHPVLPGLYANEVIEAVGVKFVAKSASAYYGAIPYATYLLAKVTVAYTQPPYEVRRDNQINMGSQSLYKGQELRRFVNWWPEPYVDQISYPSGALLFKCPVRDTTAAKPLNNVPIAGPNTLFRAEKSALNIVWVNVPIEFVCDPYGFMPKITAAIGCCNSDDGFLGRPPHTWILDNAKPINSEVYADPVATAAFEGHTRRMDISFTFRYFNPPNGEPTSTEHGWRLQPAYDGTWLPTQLQPEFAADPTKVPPAEADFASMFTYWNW